MNWRGQLRCPGLDQYRVFYEYLAQSRHLSREALSFSERRQSTEVPRSKKSYLINENQHPDKHHTQYPLYRQLPGVG